MSDAPQPAPFVVGVGRSGTTLLRLMLDAHPELAIPPETHFLPALIDLWEGGERPGSDEQAVAVMSHAGWRDFGFDQGELESIFEETAASAAEAVRAFYAAYASRHSKPRWGDKTPVYMESIARIGDTLDGQARFVHLIRDGRDVAASRGARAVKRGRSATPATKEAETWKRRIESAREQAAEVEHYLEVRYEDLIADPESTLRRVCGFAELEFDPAMLAYHEGARERLSELSDLPGKGGTVRPGSERVEAHALTSEPPRTDRIERWRKDLEPSSIADYERVAGDLLVDLGYPLSRMGDEQL